MAKALTGLPCFSNPIRFIGGVQSVPAEFTARQLGLVPHLVDSRGCDRPGSAIHLKDVNSPPISRRQIDLGRQHSTERRAESSDICDERFGNCSPLRQNPLILDERCFRNGEKDFQT